MIKGPFINRASKCTEEKFQSQAAGMADSQVMTCQPLRIRQSKFKTDFSDLFDDDDDDDEEDEEDDDRPLPPPPRLL